MEEEGNKDMKHRTKSTIADIYPTISITLNVNILNNPFKSQILSD